MNKNNYTIEQIKLCKYMSELSEQAYCAGWREDWEYLLWNSIHDASIDQIGRIVLTSEMKEKLIHLSNTCGGWIIFDEVFVTFEEWKRLRKDKGGHV